MHNPICHVGGYSPSDYKENEAWIMAQKYMFFPQVFYLYNIYDYMMITNISL